VKAVILVGGEGTRLRPLTYAVPKPLLPIANVAFLERQLTWLARHGVDEVILAMGYLPDAFRSHFGAGSWRGVRLRYAVEPEPLGTAGAIRFAAEGITERLVVCNGDVLTDLDLGAMVGFHERVGAEVTIHLVRVEDPSAFGVVPTRPDGAVEAFVEKPPAGEAPTDWVNAGTYVLEPSVLAAIPAGVPTSIERETFPALLARRGRLFAWRQETYWLDIGTPAKYRQAQRDVLAGRLGLPPAPGAREVGAGVWAQEGAVAAPDARLVAPVLLGPGCRVGAGATVADSVVGPAVVVGAGATVRGSVLLAGVTVPEGAVVEGEVVAPGARLAVTEGVA
jgi:NDP-sugar pyrophosphorylase family protein